MNPAPISSTRLIALDSKNFLPWLPSWIEIDSL